MQNMIQQIDGAADTSSSEDEDFDNEDNEAESDEEQKEEEEQGAEEVSSVGCGLVECMWCLD